MDAVKTHKLHVSTLKNASTISNSTLYIVELSPGLKFIRMDSGGVGREREGGIQEGRGRREGMRTAQYGRGNHDRRGKIKRETRMKKVRER